MLDGNWAVAIIMIVSALIGLGVSHGMLRSRVYRLEESVSRRVSIDKYEEHQRAQDNTLDEIKGEAKDTHVINRSIESKVDTLSGKTDVMINLMEQLLEDRRK